MKRAVARAAIVPNVPAKRLEKHVDAADLREKIVDAWSVFNTAVKAGDKEKIRDLHLDAKKHDQGIDKHNLLRLLKKHEASFKHGKDIVPENIKPSLRLVTPRSKWEEIFKVCRGYWSMPYSKGYGRRLRFVVYDEHHKSVIGIIGLQSPPADLACRDELFKYPSGKKLEVVNSMLDAYTIGAIPPYSNLLGGKLVASLLVSDEIRQAYWKVYAKRKTLIEGKRLQQPLVAITTGSAFGRSSIYNRLKYKDRFLAEPIGYTKGFGMIHLESIYPDIATWLTQEGLFIKGGYGNGPKVRWQNTTIALQKLGLDDMLRVHGLRREIFLFRHVKNLTEVCNEGAIPDPILCSTGELVNHWLKRWAMPRSLKDKSWQTMDSALLLRQALHSFNSLERGNS